MADENGGVLDYFDDVCADFVYTAYLQLICVMNCVILLEYSAQWISDISMWMCV